jgi:hypothetical protein
VEAKRVIKWPKGYYLCVRASITQNHYSTVLLRAVKKYIMFRRANPFFIGRAGRRDGLPVAESRSLKNQYELAVENIGS